jgi:signal transduction histidine kinase
MTPSHESSSLVDAAAGAATVAQLRAELARSQQQLAGMVAAQEEFMRAVSHDLRAPLRHVTSYGALVREALSDLPVNVVESANVQEAFNFLATMDQSARRMAQMIDGLLALAQASRAPLRPVAVDLAEALDQARAALAPAEIGRAVQWQLVPNLPQWQADPAQLQQLLVQLLGNALKFTRASVPPSIRVAVALASNEALPCSGATVQPGAPMWALSITDNGAGFDPERAGALFNVFQRLHREADFEGMGVGLALSRAIAQRHGGAVSITATPGVGCAVCVLWPVMVECQDPV